MLTQLKAGIAKMCHLVAECRTSARRPCDLALNVIWKDGRGRVIHSNARCLDISDSGARIEYREAMANLTPIQIWAAEDGGVVKTGKVRFCTPAGSAYHIGIEFC
jgi:PilZ domain